MTCNNYKKKISNEAPYKWLDFIEKGEKTYEGRLNKDDWKNMQIGDLIDLEDYTGKIIRVKISNKKYYKNFREAYYDLKKKLVPIDISVDEVVKIYSKYFSDKDIEKFGVVAIGVSPIL